MHADHRRGRGQEQTRIASRLGRLQQHAGLRHDEAGAGRADRLAVGRDGSWGARNLGGEPGAGKPEVARLRGWERNVSVEGPSDPLLHREPVQVSADAHGDGAARVGDDRDLAFGQARDPQHRPASRVGVEELQPVRPGREDPRADSQREQ